MHLPFELARVADGERLVQVFTFLWR